MKIKSGFELRHVCGEYLIIAQGIENIDFSKMIHLNESAAFLWNEAIKGPFTTAQLAEALCKEYDVDAATAEKDVRSIMEAWMREGVVEE